MFDGVITVFNYDRKTENWYPFILENVEIQKVSAASLTKTGAVSEGSTVIHIPFTEKYVRPMEWQHQTDKTGTFTLSAKNKRDFIYCGRWEGEGPLGDDAYETGLYQYMTGTYDDVYIISTVETYKTIPHWEVKVG